MIALHEIYVKRKIDAEGFVSSNLRGLRDRLGDLIAKKCL